MAHDDYDNMRIGKASPYPSPMVGSPKSPSDLLKEMGGMQDYFKRYMGVSDHATAPPEFSGESPDQIGEALEKKLAWLDNERQNVEYIRSLLGKAKFKVGDVAFIPELGNVIIKGIFVDNLQSEGMPTVKYSVAYSKGNAIYEVDKVLPYTDASRVLYTKS